jgi:hypothetical protein
MSKVPENMEVVEAMIRAATARVNEQLEAPTVNYSIARAIQKFGDHRTAVLNLVKLLKPELADQLTAQTEFIQEVLDRIKRDGWGQGDGTNIILREIVPTINTVAHLIKSNIVPLTKPEV